MKRIAVVWIGAVAVAAVLMVGASSALAGPTKLCKIEPHPSGSPCPAVDVYPAHTTFTIEGEFDLAGLTSCAMEYTFKTTSASGTPLEAEVSSFSLAACSGGDTVLAHGVPWLLEITVSGGGPNGTSKMVRSGGTPAFEVLSGGNRCAYVGNVAQKVLGGAYLYTPTVVSLPNAGGTGCVTAAELTMGGTSNPVFYVTE